MAGASIQMGVDVTQFKQGMKEAQASVKTLDAELKRSEAQLKQTGDKEQYAADKSTILQQKLNAQKTAAANCEKALKAMADNGVRESSEEYQKLARQLAEAQAGIAETTTALNQLTAGEEAAASGANQLTQSVNSIGKKISLDQVIGGIDRITTGLEGAARKAADVGKQIWENIVDAARWADDTATSANILGMDVEEYQAYRNVFATEAELTVQEWMKAKSKVQKAIHDPTKDQTDIFTLLGIKTHEGREGAHGWVEGAARDFEDVFWEIGAKLRESVKNKTLTQDEADVYAQALFGKSWANLNPIFDMGKEGFKEAVDAQVVASKEAIDNNAKLNDTLIDLQNDFNTLKQEVISGLTPALTGAAEVLDGLLEKLVAYLQSDEGKKALEDMGKAVEGLFSDLSKIDPEEVVEGFAGVFNGIVNGLTWLKENSGAVITALETIVAGWAALKITGGALTILQLIQGITGLGGAGAATAAGNAGAAAGSSWISGFIGSVTNALHVLPWLGQILGVTAVAVAPAVAQQKENEEKWKADQEKREAIAEATEAVLGETPGSRFIKQAAKALGPKKKEDGSYDTDVTGLFLNMNPTDDIPNLLMGLKARQNQEKAELANAVRGYAKPVFGNAEVWRVLNEYWETPENFDGYQVDELLASVTDALAQYEQVKAAAEQEKRLAQALLEQMGEGTEENAEQVQHITKNMARFRTAADMTPDEVEMWDRAEELFGLSKDTPLEIPAEPVAEEGAAESLADQVGVIEIPARITVEELAGDELAAVLAASGGSHANGLPFVPFDGYAAILHKGERVVPAREAYGSRTYSSNLYVENMNMNNGQDADGLAARIAARQRQMMSGYGN